MISAIFMMTSSAFANSKLLYTGMQLLAKHSKYSVSRNMFALMALDSYKLRLKDLLSLEIKVGNKLPKTPYHYSRDPNVEYLVTLKGPLSSDKAKLALQKFEEQADVMQGLYRGVVGVRHEVGNKDVVRSIVLESDQLDPYQLEVIVARIADELL